MPAALVSILEGRGPEERRALMEAVQSAIDETLSLPGGSRNLRLAVHGRDEWLLPEGATERYVLVEIAIFAGRAAETKGRLYAAIVEKLEALGVAKTDVFILIVEQPPENFGIRGGQRADLVRLGYAVKR